MGFAEEWLAFGIDESQKKYFLSVRDQHFEFSILTDYKISGPQNEQPQVIEWVRLYHLVRHAPEIFSGDHWDRIPGIYQDLYAMERQPEKTSSFYDNLARACMVAGHRECVFRSIASVSSHPIRSKLHLYLALSDSDVAFEKYHLTQALMFSGRKDSLINQISQVFMLAAIDELILKPYLKAYDEAGVWRYLDMEGVGGDTSFAYSRLQDIYQFVLNTTNYYRVFFGGAKKLQTAWADQEQILVGYRFLIRYFIYFMTVGGFSFEELTHLARNSSEWQSVIDERKTEGSLVRMMNSFLTFQREYPQVLDRFLNSRFVEILHKDKIYKDRMQKGRYRSWPSLSTLGLEFPIDFVEPGISVTGQLNLFIYATFFMGPWVCLKSAQVLSHGSRGLKYMLEVQPWLLRLSQSQTALGMSLRVLSQGSPKALQVLERYGFATLTEGAADAGLSHLFVWAQQNKLKAMFIMPCWAFWEFGHHIALPIGIGSWMDHNRSRDSLTEE